MVYPLFSRVQGSSGAGGPFDPGRPIDGAFGVLAWACALACLATRSQDAAVADGPLGSTGAAIGPLVGGLGLVGASAFAGLGWDPIGAIWLSLVLVIVLGVLRRRLPVVPIVTRRLLVTPFVLASGALFWNVVRVIAVAANVSSGLGSDLASDLRTVGVAVGFLALFSATYYAMLVYAPRQVAEREGSLVIWMLRYGLFLAGVVFGLGAWTSVIGIG